MATGSITKKGMTKEFEVRYDSDSDGREYLGHFTTKRLSIRDVAALGVRKSQLNGGMHHDQFKPGHGVDAQTDDLNSMVAHLELALISAPPWWDLSEVTDMGLLGAVYKEVISFENTFPVRGGTKASPQGGDTQVSQDGGSSASQEPEAAGAVRAVVDQEVQSALEP